MSHNHNLEKIWEFRRRDDDIDSSSDDSDAGKALQKHKLVSNFSFPETNDISESPGSDQDHYFAPEQKKANAECNGFGTNKDLVKGKKTKRGSKKEASKKKSKLSAQVPVFDDLRIFAESILKDLRVARESMFAKMREEMEILISTASTLKSKRKRGKCERKTNQRQPKKRANASVKSKKCNKQTSEANNLHNVPKERENKDQAIKTVTSDEKGDRVISSTYLTLPSLQLESQVTRNDSSLNYERGNLLTDHTTGHPDYFSSNLMDEPFRSFSQMGSKSIEPSCRETGFSVPLHQRLDNSFSIPQSIMESCSRGSNSNSILGLRMNGGALRFSGGTLAFPDQFGPSNFRNLYPD